MAMGNTVNVRISMRRAWWVRPYMSLMVLLARFGVPVDLAAVVTRCSKGMHAVVEDVPALTKKPPAALG